MLRGPTLLLLLLPAALLLGCDDSAEAPGQDAALDAADTAVADAIPDAAPDADADADAEEVDADAEEVDAEDTVGADTEVDAEPEPWVPGSRTLRGGAYFFDATGPGDIEQQDEVAGAEVYILEHPETRAPVALDGSFVLEGLPDEGKVTVALVHPDYFPHLSPTFDLAEGDREHVNFQAVTHQVAEFLGMLVGTDPYDTDACQMVVTVTALGPNQDEWWAPGEPGATVTLDPPVPPEQGPMYFNTQVVPDVTLDATTTDGGVIVFGATPGVYRWEGQKEGVAFSTLELTCIGGWLTNAAPGWGLQVLE